MAGDTIKGTGAADEATEAAAEAVGAVGAVEAGKAGDAAEAVASDEATGAARADIEASLAAAAAEITAVLDSPRVVEATRALEEQKPVLPSSDDIRREIARVKDLERLTRVLVAIGAIAVAVLVAIGVISLYNVVTDPASPFGGSAQTQSTSIAPGSQVEVEHNGSTVRGTVVARPGDSLSLMSTGVIAVNGVPFSGPEGEYPATLAKGVSFPSQMDENTYLVYINENGSATIEKIARSQVRAA